MEIRETRNTKLEMLVSKKGDYGLKMRWRWLDFMPTWTICKAGCEIIIP